MQSTSQATLAKLLNEFASLILAVFIKRDWHNVPALYSAISDAFAAIDDFRTECGLAQNLSEGIYSSPALPTDERFLEFSACLAPFAKAFHEDACALGSLATRSAKVAAVQVFRCDAELIAYLRRMESDARQGVELLRKAALIVDAQATGKTVGVLLDITV